MTCFFYVAYLYAKILRQARIKIEKNGDWSTTVSYSLVFCAFICLVARSDIYLMSAANLQVGGNPNVGKYHKGCQTIDRKIINQRMKKRVGCIYMQ